MIRELTLEDYNKIRDLCGTTFKECIEPAYSNKSKGLNIYVGEDVTLNVYRNFGYFIEDELIGVIGIYPKNNYIPYFFVSTRLQRNTFGRKLLQTVLENLNLNQVHILATLNSVSAFKRMGFKKIEDFIDNNGNEYVKMELICPQKTSESENPTMAELFALETLQMKLNKEEERRLEAEEREKIRLERIRKKQEYEAEKERKHQEYLAEKERKHQEWLEEKERRANTFEDKTLTCKKCGNEWTWTASEQKFFKEKGFFRPSICKECRSKIKVIKNFHKDI